MEENLTVTGEFTGRYTIERELGRGGAAVVYLAHDNRQERHVALKVLHKELAAAIGAKRFLREIKHSSSLQHPHLLTILDSGESRGTLYYVMPYMADGSLRTRIAREKQLPIDDALRITKDLGEALAYAHSKGIVHRDIKPDNVLFSADHACLADFGIARAVDSVAADTLTSTGLVVGTPAYMSPEQASGEKTVDARSDQYSLACLLYEMITGLPPFIGATQQSVISQRFSQPPPSMLAHRPTVPDHVERAVRRALAVVPADRFPSVKDFIVALHDPDAVAQPVSMHSVRRRWFAVGAAAAIVAVAVIAADPGVAWVRGAWGAQPDTAKFVVLPFLSEEDPALGEHVAEGVHSALRTKWEGLDLEGDVVVRQAVEDAGGDVASLREAVAIARDLGAGRLIWGTVDSERGQIRVAAHVYDVRRSRQLIEHIYVGAADSLGDSAFRFLAAGMIGSGRLPDAYDDGYSGTNRYAALQTYRSAIVALDQFDLRRARSELARAVEIDPEFAVAHLERARIHSWLDQTKDPSFAASARRAVELREELRPRDAKRAAALWAFAQEDYAGACRHYSELISSDSTDWRAWYGLGACLHADNAVLRDPRSPSGFSFRSSRHAAGVALLRAVQLQPGLYTLPNRRRLQEVFPTAGNQRRSGVLHQPPNAAQPGGRATRIEFFAVPELPRFSGDTVGFVPYRQIDLALADAERRTDQQDALRRNRDVIRTFTSGWVRAYPRSWEAHSAMAWSLEQQAEFPSAIQSLETAKRFATSDLDRLLLADAEARTRYKNGDHAGARQTAKSALARFRETTESNWQPVARLAGLTGEVSRFGEALQFFWAEFAGVSDLSRPAALAAGQALARAAVGICDTDPLTLERQLNSMLRIHVEPSRIPEATAIVGLILSYSMPCATDTQIGAGSLNRGEGIQRAQQAFGQGEAAVARALLDSTARGRAYLRAGEVSPTLVAREAYLRLALGDSTAALALIDGTLAALSTIPPSTLMHPLENATLVRMMVTRAELAVKAGDMASAGQWAQPVAVLWGRSDAAMRPIVRRMTQLAAARSKG